MAVVHLHPLLRLCQSDLRFWFTSVVYATEASTFSAWFQLLITISTESSSRL